ncbi:hypothetical protein PHYC_02086 [Phycisphaerales bacterium]|nr:hypothetical protein PHYC_02086 [Phycisphaerales bacterium]
MRNFRHAFSLVEVLISIVVLALGLLGLAAVFPAVILEQRVASDTVQGVSMEKSVVEWIEGSALFRERSMNEDNDSATNRRGWRILLAEPTWSQKGSWSPAFMTTAAVVPFPAGVGLAVNSATGWVGVGDAGGHAFGIPLEDRLFPSPYSFAGDPRFVWDFACRRIEGGTRAVSQQPTIANSVDDSVQIAFFVRRVDAGIRLRGGARSISESFLNRNLAWTSRRVPVAADENGRPAGDGFGTGTLAPTYSPISMFSYTFFPDDSNADPSYQLIVPGVAAPNGFYPADPRPYAAQVGQQFVDQIGIVHKVVQVVPASGSDPMYVRVEPPIDRRVPAKALQLAEEKRMLYTPQVPVAVVIRTIRP